MPEPPIMPSTALVIFLAPSWPASSRPSTSSSNKQDVDARHKAGHDDCRLNLAIVMLHDSLQLASLSDLSVEGRPCHVELRRPRYPLPLRARAHGGARAAGGVH